VEAHAASVEVSSTPIADASGEDSTDIKIAILLSLFPDLKQESLLDILVSCEGSVEAATSLLTSQDSSSSSPLKKRVISNPALGAQTSLSSHVLTKGKDGSVTTLSDSFLRRKPLSTKKGQTLHLFSPEDIAAYTPCTIIHNFLPTEQANALLVELLDEAKHFSRYEFQLFNRTVQSPHTASLYVSTPEEYQQHTSEYKYGGTYRSNVRQATPGLRSVSRKVQKAVNEAVQAHIRDAYPDGKKLKYQSPKEWRPNAAFVNCYDGPAENVGYHSDDLTYLGPHPIIGSLSLGVEREFRVRRVLPRDEDDDAGQTGAEDKQSAPAKGTNDRKSSTARADAQGQISIHLPHNSLLVMHAEMQEEWKHSIAPAQTISPHPISGNRRINITYRWYRDTLHPRHTPRCLCGEHAVLRCAQRKQETRGRYMWMCYAGYVPGKESCSFFQWAEFDDDGDPVWSHKRQEEEVAPALANFSASQ
jgi:alkylated DNA repair dioxygenase AlkB